MRALLIAALLLGCSDASLAEPWHAPGSLVCGWSAKHTYEVGETAAVLYPSEDAAVTWPGVAPCDVNRVSVCWPAGAIVQLWARFDSVGTLDIQRGACG